MEVLSLHALLKEGEETLFTHALSPARADRLQIIKHGCYKVLVDLQGLVKKYESLGTQAKRSWDRMRWGNEDIAEIRSRLTLNVTILTAFISTSQTSVETKLEKFIEEFHQGKREASIVSLQTADSLSADDKAVWRTIRKELEEIGISVAAFDANREFIFDWFIRAVETGVFEEENEENSDEESNLSHERKSQSSGDQDRQDMERQVEHSELEPLGNINRDQHLLQTRSLGSVPDTEFTVPKRVPKKSEQILGPKRTAPRNGILVPHVAAILAGMSRPRQRLIKAVTTKDFPKALKILRDAASFQLLDSETLNKALWTCCRVGGSDQCRLVAELIAKGSDVNYRIDEDSNRIGQTSLWNCVENGYIDSVRLLVENGANVDYISSFVYMYTWRKYSEDGVFAPRAALTRNVAILRLLLSAGVDVNAQYAITFPTFPHDAHVRGEVTLIQEAALLGAVPAIEALLEHGAVIDLVHPAHGTKLMLALSRAQRDAAQFLLARGADPNLSLTSSPHFYITPNRAFYKSPIEAAIVGGDASLLKILFDHGAVPDDDSTLSFSRTVAQAENRSHEALDREIQLRLHSSDSSPMEGRS